ncbi:MAG: SET domain-containing protein-lysine N-methyltransferase [Chitinophagaceae bacterium]
MPKKDLIVKRSMLPNAGKGLFTRVPIKKGERIVEYKGRITSWKEVSHDEGTNGYIFYVSKNLVLDAKPFKKALARYANDANGLHRVPGIKNNATYEVDKGHVYIKATKNIQAGSEILVDYGKEYWDVIRYNKRIDEEVNHQMKKQTARKKKTSSKNSIVRRLNQRHKKAA